MVNNYFMKEFLNPIEISFTEMQIGLRGHSLSSSIGKIYIVYNLYHKLHHRVFEGMDLYMYNILSRFLSIKVG